MNTPDENTEPTKIDEYQDRLIDRGLTELLGNEAPPDLSGRILSAATASLPTPIEHTKPKRFSAARWLAAGIAALLLVGATLVVILPNGKFRTAAKEAATNRLGDKFSEQSSRWTDGKHPTVRGDSQRWDYIGIDGSEPSYSLPRSAVNPRRNSTDTRKWCILATVKNGTSRWTRRN